METKPTYEELEQRVRELEKSQSEVIRAKEDLRQSENRFRAFMDNSPTISWAKDEDGKHVYLSRTYEKRFNVSFEERRGKTDFDLWPKKIAEEFRRNDFLVLKKRTTC